MNFLVNCYGWFTLFTLGSLLLKKNSGKVIQGLSFENDNLWFDSGVGFCLSFEFVRWEFLSLGLFWLKENFNNMNQENEEHIDLSSSSSSKKKKKN